MSAPGLRLTYIPTGMVLREVTIGGTWSRGMISGVVDVVGLSRFEEGQQIRWPYDYDDWTEQEPADQAIRQEAAP